MFACAKKNRLVVCGVCAWKWPEYSVTANFASRQSRNGAHEPNCFPFFSFLFVRIPRMCYRRFACVSALFIFTFPFHTPPSPFPHPPFLVSFFLRSVREETHNSFPFHLYEKSGELMNALLLRQQRVFSSIYAFLCANRGGCIIFLPAPPTQKRAYRGENSVCPNFSKNGAWIWMPKWVCKMGVQDGRMLWGVAEGIITQKSETMCGGVGTSSRKYLYRKVKVSCSNAHIIFP